MDQGARRAVAPSWLLGNETRKYVLERRSRARRNLPRREYGSAIRYHILNAVDRVSNVARSQVSDSIPTQDQGTQSVDEANFSKVRFAAPQKRVH